MTDIVDLTDQIAALEPSLGGSATMVSAFEGELSKMQDSLVFTGREVGALTAGFSGGLRRAFDGVVFDGMKLSDALKGVAKSMADTVFNTAMKPVQNAVGGMLANGINALMSNAMPFAKGGAFSQGQVMPFAKGGVVAQPTSFGMRNGTGLMGEAGPEAIMPLTRGADGRLGVQAAGSGRPVTVVMNISTPDVQGFQRSQSQIAAQAMRALARGQRNR
ncbi:MAG: phage tail tape measure protein [Candidatus Saccharibacteria bacterium]|nr:phage tail tape measure protein [Pseudorhodobacter sp.]